MPLKRRKIITLTSLAVIVVVSVVLSVISMQWIDNTPKSASSSCNYTTSEIAEKIINEQNLKDLKLVEPDQLSKHYVIPEGLVKSSTVYMANSANSAAEIACFELENENYAEQMNKVIADHMATKAAGFKDISPTEYEKVQSYVTKTRGVYTFVIVGDSSEAAAKQFENMFK